MPLEDVEMCPSSSRVTRSPLATVAREASEVSHGRGMNFRDSIESRSFNSAVVIP